MPADERPGKIIRQQMINSQYRQQNNGHQRSKIHQRESSSVCVPLPPKQKRQRTMLLGGLMMGKLSRAVPLGLSNLESS